MIKKLYDFMKTHGRALKQDKSGLAMIEFAYTLPILMGVGLLGTETANLAVANMRISQAALHVADNGSRIGEAGVLQERRIFESDINDMFVGVHLQAGEYIDIFEHGRIIMSSLQQNAQGGQWIAWQRCKGKKNHASTFGDEGDGASGQSLAGMGPAGQEVVAAPDSAVIFVEVSYKYQPIITDRLDNIDDLRAIAAYKVREARDLTQIYQRDPNDPSPVARCNIFDGIS